METNDILSQLRNANESTLRQKYDAAIKELSETKADLKNASSLIYGLINRVGLVEIIQDSGGFSLFGVGKMAKRIFKTINDSAQKASFIADFEKLKELYSKYENLLNNE